MPDTPRNLRQMSGSAVPQFLEPLAYLLVVVQVAAARSGREVDAVQQAQRPRRDDVPAEIVIQHPPCRPAVGVVSAQPPLDHGDETVLDVVESRLWIHSTDLSGDLAS